MNPAGLFHNMAATYLTPSEMTLWYNVQRLVQVLTDTSSSPPAAVDLTNPTSAAYQLVHNAATAASAEIDTYCQEGKRYTRDVLEAIIDDANNFPLDGVKVKRAAAVKELCAHLTYGRLMSRKGMAAAQMAQLAPMYESSLASLEALSNGHRLFDVDANLDASVPKPSGINVNGLNPSQFVKLFGIFPDSNFTANPGCFWGP